MLKFLAQGTRKRFQQEFDRTKITYTKCGKEINIYDEIQANREDTEIIPTLKKYGNLKPLEVDYKGMYGEFQKMDLQSAFEIAKKGHEMFDSLPAEIKNIFNDSEQEFMEKAPQWLAERIATETLPTNQTKEKTEEK